MAEAPKTEVAVIVAAFNEEQRILSVLEAVRASKLKTETTVVDDGSQDKTADVARTVEGVKVIRHWKVDTVEKRAAMVKGRVIDEAPKILAFVDADLAGLKGTHIDDIIRPLLGKSNCDMCIGIFREGKAFGATWRSSGWRTAGAAGKGRHETRSCLRRCR